MKSFISPQKKSLQDGGGLANGRERKGGMGWGNWMLWWVGCLLFGPMGIMDGVGVSWGGESAPSSKRPVPSAEELLRAEATVREVYQTELAKAATASEKQKLAFKWLEEAASTSDDPAARFALLKLAQQIGVEIGDVDLILRAIDETAKYFELDMLSAKRMALQKAAQQPRSPSAARLFAERCVGLMHQAIKHGDFGWARDCGRAAYTAAQQANDSALLKSLTAEAQRLAELQAEYEEVLSAQKLLEQKPDDSAAHGRVGRYLCLVQENWAKGLPHLARSNDPELKSAAEKDLAQPTDVRSQIDLADQWWELAQKQTGPDKEALLRRAAWWYQRALPQATGLDKTKASVRLGEVQGEPPHEKPLPISAKKGPKTAASSSEGRKLLSVPEGGNLDVFKYLDPKKHRLVGNWQFRGGRLTAVPDPPGVAALRIPILPTGGYELQLDFTRTDREGMFGLLIPVGHRQCVVVLDCRPGVHGIDMVAGRRADNNTTTFQGTLQTGRTYRLAIKVDYQEPEASITVTLDDRPWLFFRGAAMDLDVHKDFLIRGGTGLAVFTRCGLALHSLQLRPRSGQVYLLPDPSAAKPTKKE